MKRTPSKVAAEAIRELAREMDDQRRLLEEIKELLVKMASDVGDTRREARQSVSDLGARVLRLERAR